MTAADELFRMLSGEIDDLPEDEDGGVIFHDPRMDRLDLDIFLSPRPDVLDESDPRMIEEIFYIPSVLGVYVPMHSPGQVKLHRSKIRDFYWALLCRVLPFLSYFTRNDLKAALDLVIKHTYHHELFHYYCDVLRQLFGRTHDPMLEEALAVAWAHRMIILERGQWNSKIGRMNGLLYGLLMREAFAYRSPGYRDWVFYADDARFKPAVLGYVGPSRGPWLQSNGIDLDHLMFSLLGAVRGGLVESVV